MLQADQLARQARRNAGAAVCPQARVPTYQDLLDAALDATFPASDPPAIGAAMHAHEPHTTARDCHDWTLRPGACPPVGQPGDDGEGHEHAARTEARLRRALNEDGLYMPAGLCWVQQSQQTATLLWRDEGGRLQSLGVSLHVLRRLLANGDLERPEEA